MNALKWSLFMFSVAALTTVLAMTGCSKQTKEATAEETPQADTATIEAANASPEGLSIEQGNLAPQNEESTMHAEQQATVASKTEPSVPTEQPTLTPEAPATKESASYTIQHGDTLMKIAFNVYGDILKWRDIYEMNKDTIKNANSVSPGVVLKYEKPAIEPVIEKNGDAYMIKRGDTLGVIADDLYGKRSKWKALWENNRTLIKDPNKIYAGFYLYYQMSAAEKSETKRIKDTTQTQQPLAGGGQTESQKAPVQPRMQTQQSVASAAQTPVAPSVNKQSDAGGLSSLMTAPTGTTGRTPASK